MGFQLHQYKRQLKRSVFSRSSPYAARVQSVDPDTETLILDDASKSTQVRYPFVSAASWIRSMPSPGTRVVTSYSNATKKLEIVGYEFPKADQQIEAYKEKQNNYRPLRGGEHEIMSSGGAVSFYGSEKFKSDRAGVVSTKHDGIKLEYGVRAPTFIWRGARNRSDVIAHELRLGAVKRSTAPNSEAYALKLGSVPMLNQYIYANEFLLALNSDVTDTPLLDVRSGEVYEDYLTPGYPMALPATGDTGIALRHRARFFTTVEPGTVGVPDMSTDVEIDTLGNVAVNLSKLSIIGLAVKVPLGRVLAKCGLDMELNADLGIVLKSKGKIQLDATAGIELSTPANVTISGDSSVHIKTSGQASIESTGPTTVEATGPVTVSGKAGVSLKGAGGGAMLRPINTLPNDIITGIITCTDPTIKA